MLNPFLKYKYLKLRQKSQNLNDYVIYLNELLKRPINEEAISWYSNEINGATNSIDYLEKQCKISNSCSKGCYSCCNQAIYICPAEYKLLKYELRKLDARSRYELKKYSSEICSKIDKSKIPLSFSEPISFSEQSRINNNYFNLNLQCPFLKNNLCSIYNIRPVVCWSYRNYGPEKNCSANPKFGLPYIEIGLYVTERLYKYIGVHFDDYYLLPYAIFEILYNFF